MIQEMNNELSNQNNILSNKNIELQTQNSELENLVNNVINNVVIVDFSISGFKPYNGLIIYESNVYVKIQNNGTSDIEGLTLVIVGFGDESLAETMHLDVLYAGEERQISTHAYWVYGSAGTSVVTLKSGDITLDTYSLAYSDVY